MEETCTSDVVPVSNMMTGLIGTNKHISLDIGCPHINMGTAGGLYVMGSESMIHMGSSEEFQARF